MIPRVLENRLYAVAGAMPVIAVTGPRQSGKTTLCRAAFPEHAYVSLEPLDVREFAQTDPRGFLDQHRDGVVLDEVQRVPTLLSYLQEEVDRDPAPGRFVLTGSQHFGLTEAITQSLAGRIGLLHLLPMSLDELRGFPGFRDDLWTTIWTGGYPRIHDRALDPNQWLSVLETSFVVFRIPSWHRNLRKRIVKAGRFHFVDAGLACHLLGIRSPDQLRIHPLRGAVFETWVASEILKARLHRGQTAELFHLRESRGVELDLIVERAEGVIGVEVKSGATIASDFFQHLRAFDDEIAQSLPHLVRTLRLVYGGKERQERQSVEALPWDEVQAVDWT